MKNGLFEKTLFRLAGDRGLLAEYGDGIDPVVNLKVRAMTIVIKNDMPDGVIEIIPSYRSLLAVYDPGVTTLSTLKATLTTMEQRLSEVEIPPPRRVEIPVCYGGAYGPDIEYVAKSNHLTVEEVIKIHSAGDYLIYMVGFTPGFPFLGGLAQELITPRLETPRTLVPEGSVGIANAQTGVYPVASPGGWQLIGQTPLKLFAPEREAPLLYQAGDRIQFKSISGDEYTRISEKEGTWTHS
ncbi:5-oxoprolinase subunit PxpB [Desulfococcaceae bacterium HSG9]|nr:5-oxoprolinase subunit PxpB [Desulfococcaceae bacterium HSG9]